MRPYSSAIGSLTLSTSSALAQTSSAVSSMVAPVATNSSSVIEEPIPAPVSISTWCPRRVISCTPAGVMATRYSWFLISRGTPTITVCSLGGFGPDWRKYRDVDGNGQFSTSADLGLFNFGLFDLSLFDLSNVDDGIPTVDQGGLGVTDDHSGAVGMYQSDPLAERIEQAAEAFALLDSLPEPSLQVQHARAARADPAAAPAFGTGVGGVRLEGVDHVQVCKHALDADHASVDRPWIHAPGLAGFIEQDLGAAFTSCVPQRSVAQPSMHHDGCGEGFGQFAGFWILQVSADLRQVGTSVRSRVQVDPDRALGNDLGHHQMRDASGQRAAG